MIVCIQDLKERQVYWFLFPLIGITGGILYFKETLSELFLTAVIGNLVFVGSLLVIVFLYAGIILKSSMFQAFGLGDILFFISVSCLFSTVSFILIFISALIFSLVLHILLKSVSVNITVPLAGYMSLFFMLTYASYWLGVIEALYII